MTACREPLRDEVLLDWWCGEPIADRGRIEEHLLGCGPCSDRAARLQPVAEGVRQLMRGGELALVIVPAVLGRLRRDGRRIREYAVPAGGAVHCTVSPDDDVLLARLGADLHGVSRLDLVSRVDDGPEHRLSDLPFDPASGELLLLPPVALVRARPANVERMELLAVEPEGERLLGRYEFDHTPWAEAGRR